jgi:hypothetical protein
VAALQGIRETGKRRKTPKIPQLEGAEPTPEPTPETTPNSSLTQEDHYLSPEVPWSPLRQSHQHDDYSEGDLDTIYQRHMDEDWQWDDIEHQLSFLQPVNESFSEIEVDDFCPLSFTDLPQRRHTFNGFVLPFTFTKRSNQ